MPNTTVGKRAKANVRAESFFVGETVFASISRQPEEAPPSRLADTGTPPRFGTYGQHPAA